MKHTLTYKEVKEAICDYIEKKYGPFNTKTQRLRLQIVTRTDSVIVEWQLERK